MPHRAPGSPGQSQTVPHRKTDSLLPAEGQPGGEVPHRRGISGVQRRPAVGGMPDFRGEDAGARERDDDRPDRGGRHDAGRARRVRHRDDGPRSGRLHHLDRRQPLSRPPLRAEFHAAPRFALPERRRAVRRGRHPHLRRAFPGDRAARDRRLHPGLHRPLGPERADRDLGVPLPAGPRPARTLSRVRGAFRRRAGRAGRRAPLHLVARRQLDRHEHRVSRADERQPLHDRSRTRTSTRSVRSCSPASRTAA